MLMVEHHSGESEMDDDEYERRLWPADRLRPARGGRVFVARTVGNGYERCGGVKCTRGREGQVFVAGLRSVMLI
jgi:hypothetical protein